MLSTGSRIGAYEIKSPLGEGGMGVVFRALDTKLQRDVALKLLPDHFADDPERMARFQREAQVLASLNHPNIAHIHGLEDSTAQTCIVMELVDGQTIQERLKRGPIPWSEALPLAKQICEALEAAHERGIVHRDLKPANIKITSEGTVKVLDFGLAKAMSEAKSTTSGALLSNSPTLSMAATNAGVILGTAAYMSPEQAKGRTVDKRTDVFAFGCVLFEMLAGRPAFDGDDVTEILGRVVTAEPDWNNLPADVPPVIVRLIRRALRKDSRQRLGDIHDARIEIEECISEPPLEPLTAKPEASPGRNTRAVWMLAIFALVTALALAVPAIRRLQESPAADPAEIRLEIATPATSGPLEFALSPDGRYIVFAASGDGPQRLWLRALNKTDAQPMAGTEGAGYPFWSADSRSIGFYASGRLKRVDITGGSPQVLTNASATFGGSWNADGTILFSSAVGPLSRINAAGGNAVQVTTLDSPRQVQHRYPQFLPDGRHFLFYGIGTAEGTGVYLASLDGGEPKRLTPADSAGAYLAPGILVFGRGTSLLAQALDLKRGELTGDPVKLTDFVAAGTVGAGGVSVSNDGRIAYREGGGSQRRFKWYDRTGKPLGAVGEPDAGSPLYPDLSPDGRQVGLSRTVQGNTDIWLLDLIRGGMTRFTFDSSLDIAATWSPEGRRIAFASSRKGPYNLYLKESSNAVAEKLLFESANTDYPQDWSKDGRFLLYSEIDPKTGRDLWALPMSGANASPTGRSNQVMSGEDRKPLAVANTPFDEQNGQFSPNGQWVAYQTNESGDFQIVVQPFPNPTSKWQVSTAGGTQPRWRADGKELYFIAADGKMMATTISQSPTFSATAPVPLFMASPVVGLGANRQQYVVSRDGRFLINQPEASANSPIILILNWKLKP